MTYFTGQPLFGKDSSPHYTSKIIGFFGTCAFWLLFLICAIFIRPGEKAPKYKEVQIVLESAPTVEKRKAEAPKQVSQAAQSSGAKAKVEEKKVSTPPAPAPVKKTPAPAPAKKTPAPAVSTPPAPSTPLVEEDPWDDFEYALDPMEAFAQQTASTQTQEVDWDAMFEETPTAKASTSGGKVIGSNEYSGSAGTVSGTQNSRVTSSQVGGGGSPDNWEASSATSTALGDISNTRFVGTSNSNVSSETNVQSSTSGDGKVYIKMSNGKSRALIRPAEPGIKLSKEAEAAIDGSKNVKIRFMVTKNGNVPATQISITPAALLPAIVQQEIRAQISQWVFESDNYEAFAEFEYNIVKK